MSDSNPYDLDGFAAEIVDMLLTLPLEERPAAFFRIINELTEDMPSEAIENVLGEMRTLPDAEGPLFDGTDNLLRGKLALRELKLENDDET